YRFVLLVSSLVPIEGVPAAHPHHQGQTGAGPAAPAVHVSCQARPEPGAREIPWRGGGESPRRPRAAIPGRRRGPGARAVVIAEISPFWSLIRRGGALIFFGCNDPG